jgi:VanZ family protein
MQATLKYYWPAILWAIFVFTLCTIHLGNIGNSPLFFPGFDKLVHCGFFFVFVIFYSQGLVRKHKLPRFPYKHAVTIVLIAILYGYAIELLQKYVFTWRDFEWNDVFADSVGACMGMFSVLILSAAFYHEKK